MKFPARRRCSSERGFTNILVTAIGFPVLLLLAAISWDATRLLLIRRDLQNALQRGAIEAALAMHPNPDPEICEGDVGFYDNNPPPVDNMCRFIPGASRDPISGEGERDSCANTATQRAGIISANNQVTKCLANIGCLLAREAMSSRETSALFSGIGDLATVINLRFEIYRLRPSRGDSAGSASISVRQMGQSDGTCGDSSLSIQFNPSAVVNSGAAYFTLLAQNFPETGVMIDGSASDYRYVDQWVILAYGEIRATPLLGRFTGPLISRDFFVYPLPATAGMQKPLS